MVIAKEIKEKIIIFKFRSLKEFKETVLMIRLLSKKAKTPEEHIFVRQQSVDLVKISIVIVIGALPGGSFVVAFIETGLRKVNRTILPTAFSKVPDNQTKSEDEKRSDY